MFSFNWSSGLLLLLTLCFLLYLVFVFRPVWLIKIWNRIRILRAGLSKHFLKITDELEISYFERKGTTNEQTLLFVHGFSGEKEVYCDFVRLLPMNYHVIMIDLPGHGESKPNDDKSDYTISSQVKYLHKFIKAFGFGGKKINLVGTSMGGHIVGVYAAKYGETLSSVVLVCPGGIDGPETTAFIQKSRKDMEEHKQTNALLPQTVEEFLAMIKLVLYHDVNVHKNIAGALLELKKVQMNTHQKVFRDLAGACDEYYLLDSVLENIKVPLLCIWGKNDKVLHVSGSEVINKRVQNAKVHIVERCGHAIVIDRPRKFVKIMLEFLGN